MDGNNINEITDLLMNILKPILISVATVATGSAPIIIKSIGSKITKSVETKNELDQLEKINNMKSKLMDQISAAVKIGVAANMQIANKMKNGGKLTDEQITELNTSAKKLIMDSLPESLTKQDGTLNNIIGGTERLNLMIDGMLEQHVYEYKISDKK